MVTDSEGNSYVAGLFSNETPQIGLLELTNNGNEDIFIAKISDDGIVEWAHGVEDDRDKVNKLLVDSNRGVIYMVGQFESSSISFGSTTLTNVGDSSTLDPDIFVAQLSTSGNWQWAKAGGGQRDYANSAVLDLSGNVVIIGTYEEDNGDKAVDFGPYQLTVSDSSNDGSGFIAKVSPSGNWLMAEEIKGEYCSIMSLVEPRHIMIDNSGNLYVAGMFCESVSFDSITLTSQHTSNSQQDDPISAFVAK